MKIANVLLVLALLALTPVLVLQRRSALVEKQARAVAEQELEQARVGAASGAAEAEKNAAELTRLREQQAELIKLRGEVTSLRREKDELTKKLAAAASKPAQRPESQQVAQTQTPTAAPAAENLPGRLANEVGNLRRKLLNGEALTEAERAFLESMQSRVADFEKSPEAFAEFQSAYVASVLGWANNEPRVEQLKTLLTAVSKVANARGLTFNALGQSYDTWDNAQKMLDTRATGAAKKFLTPEEQAVFDRSFPGIMSADLAAAPRK